MQHDPASDRSDPRDRKRERRPEAPAPAAIDARGILALQRTAGNRAVSRVIIGAARAARQPAGAAPAPAVREQELAAAFKRSVFYYGVTERRGAMRLFLEKLMNRDDPAERQAVRDALAADGGAMRAHLEQLRTSDDPALVKQAQHDLAAASPGRRVATPTGKTTDKPYYWPGERITAYARGRQAMESEDPAAARPDAPEAQMMDMYYGEKGTTLHELRNPVIGQHVHEQMKYVGPYDQHKSGRDAYMETYSTGSQAGVEGWRYPKNEKGEFDPAKALFGTKDNPLTGTMEISRLIREGVFKYGGTIVFEGKYVWHSGNFVAGAYQGDTNKEAIALFPYFTAAAGRSSVPFGQGTLTFHYGGRETVPTQWLFRQRWSPREVLTDEKAKALIPKPNLFWDFPSGDPSPEDEARLKERADARAAQSSGRDAFEHWREVVQARKDARRPRWRPADPTAAGGPGESAHDEPAAEIGGHRRAWTPARPATAARGVPALGAHRALIQHYEDDPPAQAVVGVLGALHRRLRRLVGGRETERPRRAGAAPVLGGAAVSALATAISGAMLRAPATADADALAADVLRAEARLTDEAEALAAAVERLDQSRAVVEQVLSQLPADTRSASV